MAAACAPHAGRSPRRRFCAHVLCTALVLLFAAGCETGVEPFETASSYLRVSAGDEHTCAVTTDEELVCWGRADVGRLGFTAVDGPCSADRCVAPVRVDGMAALETLSAGQRHTCGLLAGEAYCWGYDRWGQLGAGNGAFEQCNLEGVFWQCATQPLAVQIGYRLTRIAVGSEHTCALDATGRAWCWGMNNSGQLGDGTVEPRSVPTAVAGGLRFTDISAGFGFTCAIATDASAWCWGAGAAGRLGTGTLQSSHVPVPVSGGLSFARIDLGDAHACGITVDSQAWCWGWGANGRVGSSAPVTRVTPIRANIAGTMTFVSAGSAHTCALKDEGLLYCWGANSSGQIGDGSGTDQLEPTLIAPDLRFSTVSTGAAHTCAIAAPDGDLYCWGENAAGQLGTGSTADQPLPVPAG